MQRINRRVVVTMPRNVRSKCNPILQKAIENVESNKKASAYSRMHHRHSKL